MREIVFDTETTGLDPKNGDRVVEIGMIELVNHIPTGQTFHRYVNPERSMPAEALRIHGLDDAFLADKPLFAAVVDELLDFIGEATLIAHNSEFDMAYLNAELARISHTAVPNERVIDTLMLARRRHPAGPNSLDALCNRYQVDTTRRTRANG
jgi:DNA polymerase-3 subunit epsilon